MSAWWHPGMVVSPSEGITNMTGSLPALQLCVDQVAYPLVLLAVSAAQAVLISCRGSARLIAHLQLQGRDVA
jgi:hypothetical protein